MRESVRRFKAVLDARAGFFTSYVLRAHHPEAPYALWLRYSITQPPGQEEGVMGECWGVFFDGRQEAHTVVRKIVPREEVFFAPDQLDVRLGSAVLNTDTARGEADLNPDHMTWQIDFTGNEPPVFLLPPRWYEKAFPRSKSLVLLPLARFEGSLEVNGKKHVIDGWKGSINHHWGRKYTGEYAWGQVAGFDTHPDSFLEAATSCLRWGPLKSPNVTPVVFRHRGEEFAFNTFFHLCDSRGSFSESVWVFRAEMRGVRIEGTISGHKGGFVGLPYRNPSGGLKYCLNTQLAACEVRFEDSRGNRSVRETLFARHRAAFEIVTNRTDLSIAVAGLGT